MRHGLLQVVLAAGLGCAARSLSSSSGGGGSSPTPPAVICPAPLALIDVSGSSNVVGSGAPGSCTEEALARALESGGVITFQCGAQPFTLHITSEKAVNTSVDTVIDGGGLITLDGSGASRILALRSTFDRSGPTLRLQRLTLQNGRGAGSGLEGGGGAVYHLGGTVEAVECNFLDNAAEKSGPDVGGGAVYGDGVGDTVAVNSVFSGNEASNGGAIGALYNGVTVVNVRFLGNQATGSDGTQGGNGGAVYMDGENKPLVVCGAVFTGNTAGYLGSAIFRTAYHTEATTIDRTLVEGNRAPRAAIYLMGTALAMSRSTVAGNTGSQGWGGLYVSKHVFNGSDVPGPSTLTNVTLADNDAGSSLGGALWVDSLLAPVTLTHVTLAGNRALFDAGVGGSGASTVTYQDTLVANNVAINAWNPLGCAATGAGAVMQWPATQGNGSIPDTACAPSTTWADPLLEALLDNGGPTPTLALGAGSPAIGKGAFCTGDSATDQRGLPRKATGCALGSYEPQSPGSALALAPLSGSGDGLERRLGREPHPAPPR